MSDNLKYFFKTFLNLVFLRLISRIIPIVMMTYYIIPIIGFSSFGKLEFAKVLNYFFKIIIAYGFSYTIPKIFFNNKNNKDFEEKEIGNIIGSIFIVRGFLILLCTVILIFLIVISETLRNDVDVIFYFYLVAISSGLYPICIYQSIEKIHIVTILNSITKLLFYLSIPFYIKSQADVKYYPISYSIVEFLRLVLSYFILFYFYKIKVSMPNIESIKKHFIDGFSGFSFSLYMLLYTNFPMMFLKFYFGNTSVGIYKLGTYISHIIQQILEPFLQCFYPILSKKMKINIKQGIEFALKILIPTALMAFSISLLCCLFPKNIIIFFCGKKIDIDNMKDIISIFKINSITTFFTILSSYVGVQILRSIGYRTLYSVFLFISFIISVLLHFIYVINRDILSSMYSILISEIVLFCMVMITFLIYYFKNYKKLYNNL